jgi:hypothetical protein
MCYLFAVFLIFGGQIIDSQMSHWGWKALGLTVALNLIIPGLGFYISSRRGWVLLRVLQLIFGLVIAVLAGIGGLYIFTRYQHVTLSGGRQLMLALGIAVIGWLLLAISSWRRHY